MPNCRQFSGQGVPACSVIILVEAFPFDQPYCLSLGVSQQCSVCARVDWNDTGVPGAVGLYKGSLVSAPFLVIPDIQPVFLTMPEH